jgi:magnesium chelatase family protein
MVARVSTVAFEGIEARAVDVQVQVAPGLPQSLGVNDKFPSWGSARKRHVSCL